MQVAHSAGPFKGRGCSNIVLQAVGEDTGCVYVCVGCRCEFQRMGLCMGLCVWRSTQLLVLCAQSLMH